MNPLRKFYEKHPKFRTGIEIVAAKLSSVGIIYWVGAAVIISTVALSLFLRLPDELKIPVTAIISTILTSLVIPFILNSIKTKNERKDKLYERNLPFYKELASKTIDVFQTTEQTEQRRKIVTLANFIADNYPDIIINLSTRQNDLLFSIKDECLLFFDSNNHTRASINNIYGNAERFFSEVRKQGNISGYVFLSKRMIEKLEMPELGNMNPPSV